MRNRHLAVLARWNAWRDLHIFERFAEPIRLIAAICQQSSRFWQIAHEGSCTDRATLTGKIGAAV